MNICQSCGGNAVVTRTFWDKQAKKWVEICDARTCGDIRIPAIPDAFFRRPYFDENLASSENPHGVRIESKRHKAEILKKLGLREDGDRYHGALEKGISNRIKKPRFTSEFKRKLASATRTAIKKVTGARA